MPRAGWCRECGEWVWVDEDDACQHGHGSECVGGIYDATPQTPERGVGAGDMPADFERFNWGAFLLPFFWGIAYGVWPVVSLWLLALITPFMLFSVAGAGGESSIEASMLGITIVSEIVAGALRIYIGMNANRLLWKREQLRLQLIEGAATRVSMRRFIERQKVWTAVGWVLMAMSIGVVAFIGFLGGENGELLRTQFGVTRADTIASTVWLLAEIMLGAWMAAKMASGSGAPGDTANDAAR